MRKILKYIQAEQQLQKIVQININCQVELLNKAKKV